MPYTDKVYGIGWRVLFLVALVLLLGACGLVLADAPPLPGDYFAAKGAVFQPPEAPAATTVTNKTGEIALSSPAMATNAVERTVITIWLTDELTGEPFAAFIHRTPRKMSFYKVEIAEE